EWWAPCRPRGDLAARAESAVGRKGYACAGAEVSGEEMAHEAGSGRHVLLGSELDGWHRGAAWVLQGQAGKVYPISAMLIVTKRSLHMGQGAASPRCPS